ncbi:hypothetical protein [Azoarcus sp. KH32C]|uniref:hypothetical protein n=1 Tax=Azoarcus sp. KH32C TaxID=748247 RepID=UPI000349F74E|nr:hypothetical protein [Azoarcus sp. KH32C]
MTMQGQTDEDIGIALKVAFLGRPAAYPDGVGEVRAVETHMSWVFLADGFAYKLKKPVCLPYRDFSSLEARRINSEDELRLNRRLSPAVYLGVVPLTREAGGGLALGGTGPVVDWLVKMRRLPEAAMLDRLIGEHAVPRPAIDALVANLASFYREAPVVDWAPGEYVRRLGEQVQANADELMDPRYGLAAGRVRGVLAAQQAFLHRAADRFEQRVRERRVVEGHGDLRPEHVCLTPEPAVIDCLEFNRELRLLDAAEDFCFLVLECERLGDAALGAYLLAAYARASGDAPDAGLLSFYKCRRATLRAKTAAWHLHDEALADPGKWLSRACVYLDIATRHAAALG